MTELTWNSLTAVYEPQELADLKDLPAGETLVIHALKAEFEASATDAGSGDSRLSSPKGAATASPVYAGSPGYDRRDASAGFAASRPEVCCITLVATQRTPDPLLDQAEAFIDSLRKSPIPYHVVLGDSSELERVVKQRCEDQDIPVTIVAKADKGCWDEGAQIRDERVVALADAVYAFDMSARSKNYKDLAKRQRKPFHTL